jgi:hypothetical protein
MADTPHMAQLLRAVSPAVLRAIGDDRQLPAIGAAGWYAEQLERHGGAELTTVYRQRDTEDVRDFTDLGAGGVEEAVRSLDERDRIHVLDEYRQRAAAIIDLYLGERMRGRGPGGVGIVVDGSNHDLDDLNRRIQRERIVMEEISPRGLELRAVDEDRSWSLHRGDLVVFRKRVVTGADEVIRNGEQGRVVTVDHGHHRITVALDSGRRVTVDLRAEAPTQPVVPAYAAHVTTFIGGEKPVVIASPSRHATRHGAYTSITRAVEDLHVVIDRETFGRDPIEGLIRDWLRTAEKRTAWAQLDDASRERWARWKDGQDAPAADRTKRTVEQDPAGREVDPNADTVPMAQPTPPCGRHAAPRDDDARERRNDAPAGRHRKPEERDDIAEEARRSAQAAEDRRDHKVVHEQIQEVRDAEAHGAALAADREASESLIHDVDIGPPWPRAPFASIDERPERRWDVPTHGRHHREPDRGDAGPAVSPQPTPPAPPAHEWFDLEGFLTRGTPTHEHDVATQQDVASSRHAGEPMWFDLDKWLRRRMQEPDSEIPPPDHERDR